jgi:lipopolysaccharide transport system ATP-binding protein
VRQLCDQVIWIDRGEVRALGATEDVLAGYETHVRNQIAADHRGQVAQTTEQTPFMMPAAVGGNAKLISVDVQTLGKGMPPLLVKDELRVTITAYAPNGERPNMAMMLERSDKVCITSAGTDGDVKPKPLGDGFWRASVVFPDLQLYSGEYMVSAYLFDETGTLVYEEWLACQRFTVVRPMREIGMVRLPRVWS